MLNNINWWYILKETLSWLKVFLAVYGLYLISSQNQIISIGILIFYIGIYESKSK